MRTHFDPKKPVGSSSVRSPAQESQTPFLDRDLSVYRDGMRWHFSGGKIFIDKQEINQLLNENNTDVALWMGLAQGLDDYRKKVILKKRQQDVAKFEAMIETLMGKILAKLKKAYDQKMSGLSWTLEHGQLILNGINVRSFMALYRIRKTDKAHKFLKGLRGKLSILLENHRESPDYERIRDVVEALSQEIDAELAAETSSRPSVLLVSPRSNPA